jgi:hypothetical protein
MAHVSDGQQRFDRPALLLDCLHVAECPGDRPLISAESEWADVYAYAQFLLDRHEEHRARVDEARHRARAAARMCGDLRSRSWPEVEGWGAWSRPVRDYASAVRKTARFLCLGEGRAAVVHELAGREGYELRRPTHKAGPRAPAPAVASAMGADTTGDATWRSGAAANRQARLRYLATTASRPDRTKFKIYKESL